MTNNQIERTMKQITVITLLAAAFAWPAVAQTQSGYYRPLTLAAASADGASSGGGGAADEANAKAAELAKELSNPIANLISVPIQNNWDFGIGPANAMRYTANIQLPISFGIGGRYYAEGPTGGPEWGLRFIVQFLIPK